MLSDIAEDLRTNPADLTSTDLSRLDAGYLRMQNDRANQLESQNRLSEVEGVDLPATMVELQLQEVAYKAALGATAKALQPSLMDFLR